MRKRSVSNSGRDDLFGWTVFILLLSGFAAICWIGSFYVFGHPEKSFSYRILRALDKIEAPQRFQLTSAPRGRFLKANQLMERFGLLPPQQLAAENETLLREYLRNYKKTRQLVPYVIGPFKVMGIFRLGSGNFFSSGVVALARSTENPAVLLELIFPAEEKNIANLESMLVTGLNLKLVKTLDLAAVINSRIMPNGNLCLTAVPLLYGSYTSSDASGTFSLEPPQELEVGAGLPILNQAAIEKAESYYKAYRQRAGLLDQSASALKRVHQPEAVQPGKIPVRRAEPVQTPPRTPLMPLAIARAVAVAEPNNLRIARAVPVNPPGRVPVARAVPINPAENTAVPRAVPTRLTVAAPPTPDLPTQLQPFAPIAPVSVSSTAVRDWKVHQAGQMPLGRLFKIEEARQLAGTEIAGQATYLAGDFNVSASGASRAVLRSKRGGETTRVIVDFPSEDIPPRQGSSLIRGKNRPFLINRVEQGADGQINIYVREITRP